MPIKQHNGKKVVSVKRSTIIPNHDEIQVKGGEVYLVRCANDKRK